MNNLFIVYSEENTVICIVEDCNDVETIKEATGSFYDHNISGATLTKNYDDQANTMQYTISGEDSAGEICGHVLTLEKTYLAKQQKESQSPRVIHPQFPEHISEISGRKQNGIDCTEDESGIIKHYIIENSEKITTSQISKDNDDYLSSLFPCEYSEAWEIIEEK